jgi:hypothetical protein
MAKRGAVRRRQGGATIWLVLVVGAAAAAGAWNYQRNLRAEEQARAARPFGRYALEDLEALADAYRGEVDRMGKRYEGAHSGRVATREHGFFGDQLDEYERVRRSSSARREVGAVLSEREAALRDVEQELQRRQGEAAQGIETVLRRILSF